jgi:phage terminase large subunit
MPTIQVPFNFTPRRYQLPVLRALDGGCTRAVAVWHRRSGKEKTFINYTARKCIDRVGTYFYAFPTYTQGKRAIWDGRDRDGFPFLGHFPPEIVKAKDATELKITLINGSIFQLVGTDNIDSLMSTNPLGVVFAEYSLQDPRGWDYLRPILRENGGWAVFDYTPRGKNHGYTLYEMARKLQADGDPAWFAQRLTVADTGVISPAEIEAERREGMDEEMIQQEYYCSFAGAMQGSIFGKQMDEADQEGRICAVPWQREFPVSTWWDIGTGDATAIWFTQDVGREVHVIDYYENSGPGVGIDHYIRYLQSKPYIWGTHNGPHDMRANSFAAGGISAWDQARALGIHFEVVPRVVDKQDSINAARAFVGRCWFDRVKTERGRLALISYHRTWDERRRMYSTAPYHDWSADGADGFQCLAMGHKTTVQRRAAEGGERESRRMLQGSSEPGTSWLGT